MCSEVLLGQPRGHGSPSSPDGWEQVPAAAPGVHSRRRCARRIFGVEAIAHMTHHQKLRQIPSQPQHHQHGCQWQDKVLLELRRQIAPPHQIELKIVHFVATATIDDFLSLYVRKVFGTLLVEWSKFGV